MDATAFWNVIGEYNQHTLIIQIVLLITLVTGVTLSYLTKNKWIVKLVLGIMNLYIAIGFFAIYGTEPIQKYFALPLYLVIGIMFIAEAVKNKQDVIEAPGKIALVLMLLYVLYPVASIALGAFFPKMVTHVMPCPVVTISIAIYACYRRKNKILLLLLTIWGLTGIKSVFFSAYEDIILLLAGIYGAYMLFVQMKQKRT